MQYTDRERIARVLAGWGVLGVFVMRAVDFVERMKRPEPRQLVQDFKERYGDLGGVVLQAYNTVDPLGIYNAEAYPDAHLFYAEEFMSAWESPAVYRGVAGAMRIDLVVRDTFASDNLVALECGGMVDAIGRMIWRVGFPLDD